MPPAASIVIATRNRREELAAALRSALAQSVPVEVLVMDDASTDGTAEMVRADFPSVRLERSNSSLGCIAQRNRGVHLAAGKYVFSIDDDAVFSTPRVVEQTLRDFTHPRIGAVAIPYVEPQSDYQPRQLPPDSRGVWLTDAYVGTAHAVRRDLFVKLHGYREHLVHQGEERDYCLRLFQVGCVIRLGRADFIHHFESPRRDLARMDFYERRNDILFAVENVPQPYFLAHLVGTSWNGLRSAVRVRRFDAMLKGMLRGYVDSYRLWNDRQPVPAAIYRLHRRLKKRGPIRLKGIESMLPRLS